ncbi:MAG: hypothetical protein K8J08_17545, partial [Thermoanaerobaculia bacterium]|nr:hypothetical protein [Thermoanaerobaculia bacterium]
MTRVGLLGVLIVAATGVWAQSAPARPMEAAWIGSLRFDYTDHDLGGSVEMYHLWSRPGQGHALLGVEAFRLGGVEWG